MAPTAEISKIPEVYARSLRTMSGLGWAAIRGYETDLPGGVVEEAWRDFETAVGENLTTDQQFGERLVFDPLRSYDMVDGAVVDSTGQRLSDLVERGWQASHLAAADDPEMAVQAERDEGDVLVAQAVDNLQVGELYAVVSLDPKAALQRNPDYWQQKGYREGMAVAQVYYRAAENEMLAGAYSIKQSDTEVLRGIFAQYGVDIPVDESDNRWIRHGIRLQPGVADREAAEQFGGSLVESHRQALGQVAAFSVTEFMRQHRPLALQYFYGYVEPLARSYVSGRSEPRIQSLADAMLHDASAYSQQEAGWLWCLAAGQAPDADSTRFMEEKIRYALVEELREKLVAHMELPEHIEQPERPIPALDVDEAAVLLGTGFYEHTSPIAHGRQLDMSARMAAHIAAGASAGRSYGGCTSAGASQNEAEAAGQSGAGAGAESQGVFGGRGETLVAQDKYGSLQFKCPQGHTNTRPRNKLIERCQVCKCSVRC